MVEPGREQDQVIGAVPDQVSRDMETTDAAEALLGMLPAGAVLTYLIERLPVVQRARARSMLSQLLEIVAVDHSEVMRRFKADETLMQLVWKAARAATQTQLDAKVTALARIVAPGWSDEAMIDEARYIVQTLNQLEVMHLRVLRALERGGSDDQPYPFQLDVASALSCSRGLGQAIAADLVRLGVAEQGMRPAPPMGSTPNPNTVAASAFGAQVLTYLKGLPIE